MNTVPPTIVPSRPRVRRQRTRGASAPPPPPPPPPVPLQLVAASYETATLVILTFDRAVDASALDGGQIEVSDQAGSGVRYAGTVLLAHPEPQQLQIGLTFVGEPTAEGVVLDASAATGIVAVDDGGTWGGVFELSLPWP